MISSRCFQFSRKTPWQVLFIDTVRKKSIRLKLVRELGLPHYFSPRLGLSINQSFGWFIHMPCVINYCGIVTFLAMSTFQVLKATTMTSVMFLQDLKSKNTQVSRTGAVRTVHNSAVPYCALSVRSRILHFWISLQTGSHFGFLDFWISGFLETGADVQWNTDMCRAALFIQQHV